MRTFALPGFAALVLLASTALVAAERVQLTVTHDLPMARPAETITIPWFDLATSLPGIRPQYLAVKDSVGRELVFQFVSVPRLGDVRGEEAEVTEELVFQYDFPAGKKSATFTIEPRIFAAEFPGKVFARAVPERYDDFAWENDRVAHRTYGPALAAPAPPGTKKEVLVASGIDVWAKRVPDLIVDRWYQRGDYHDDNGEGLDFYQVGGSRGAGGTGIWDGTKLHVARNYVTAKVIANGPIRAIFDLTYAEWTTGAGSVAEIKRFTVDAGHNLDQVESIFTVVTGSPEIVVAIGLNKQPATREQGAKINVLRREADAALVQWAQLRDHGALGTAIVVGDGAFSGFASDAQNDLILAEARSGDVLRYLVGAGWDRAGEFSTQQVWLEYVAVMAARLRSPVRVELAPQ